MRKISTQPLPSSTWRPKLRSSKTNLHNSIKSKQNQQLKSSMESKHSPTEERVYNNSETIDVVSNKLM